MSYTLRVILCFVTAFGFGIILEPFVIMIMRRLKARQTILHYVDKHEGKSGTPTMGGVGFLLALFAATLIFAPEWDSIGIIAAVVTLCYGVVGFLDDFLKVRRKENQGLKAYQKIIGQLGIAVFVTVYCMRNPYIGTKIALPFTDYVLDLEWWFVPMCLIAFIGMSNAVNLTDGLDGLVGKSASAGFAALSVALLILLLRAQALGDVLYEGQIASLAYFSTAVSGALLSFVWFNANPAKIFMGDTGSLAIGGAMACVGVFSGDPLILLFVGIMYLWSCISVVMQVIAFKTTKKRIFLMAPYHHHLEYKGIKECKIVTYYTIITIIGGLAAISSVLVR